jgi:LPS sulfotransferase NodH
MKLAGHFNALRRPESVAEGWDQFGPLYDHPPFDGIPRVFLIASSPRAGSNYLGHLLFNTGALGSPLEYFNPVHIPKWQRLLDAPDLTAMFQKLAHRRTSPNGWFGAKVNWRHFAPVIGDAALVAVMGELEYIRITRRDLIGRAVSHAIARQTGAWVSFHAIKQAPHYDFAAIKEALARIEEGERRWDDFFTAAAIKPLTVAYEEMVADPAAIVDRVSARLGLAERTPVAGPPLLPRRQSTGLNAEWKERFLADLAASD